MFRYRYRYAECPHCGERMRFARKVPHHSLHAVLSVLSGGLWIISWVAVCVGTRHSPWRCRRCRARPAMRVTANHAIERIVAATANAEGVR